MKQGGARACGSRRSQKLLARPRKQHGPQTAIQVVYEAGPCGFAIARRMAQWKIPCTVVAPSLTTRRIERCEQNMRALLQEWRLRDAVAALMAFKGFQLVAAMILVSELGDLHRFSHPRQLMAYLGLVPGEASSGEDRRQGSITKCGNSHARWILIECSQHYATAPKVSKELSRRQQGQPPKVVKTSWQTQHRLHLRFSRLMARRVQRNKIMVALARELIAFIWEALNGLECYNDKPGQGLPDKQAA